MKKSLKTKYANLCEDITKIIKEKIKAERMLQFFSIDQFEFAGDIIKIREDNSILMRFRGITNEQDYRMLFIFSLCDEQTFSHKLQNELQMITDQNIDKIVIWSKYKLKPEIIQNLRKAKTHVIYIDKKDIEKTNLIRNFCPINNDYSYSVELNKMTDLIILRMKKLFHLILSEIAAPIYDESYGKNKVGTQEMMSFEEEIISSLINRLTYENNKRGRDNAIAIDVGCGTGRHALKLLSSNFDKVFGFDFSPAMIDVANQKKRMNDVANVIFSVVDVEYEEIVSESRLLNNVDLVLASFGMGSFIEDIPKILRRYYEWLKPDGYLFLSFYNENSILLNLVPNWRDTSLSALIDVAQNTLEVELSKDIRFKIFCKAFGPRIKSEIGKKFDIIDIFTFPTTMALLPNTLLEDRLARELFSRIDKTIATDSSYNYGHYVLVITRKPSSKYEDAHKRILSILKERKIEYEIIEHDLVLSISDVKQQIGDVEGCMVKTIIFRNRKINMYFAVVIEAEKEVDINLLSMELNLRKSDFVFATEKEILKLGFPLGGIAPIGYESIENVEVVIDKTLFKSKNDIFYMGVGDNKKTLKLKREDFLKLVSNYKKIQIK